MELSVRLFVGLFLLLPAGSSAAQDRLRHFNDVHQAFSAARGGTPLEAQSICQDLPSVPVLSENDVRALYAELTDPKICEDLEPVSQALGQCGDEKYQPMIAAWIAKEKTLFPDRGTKGAYNARSERKLAVREKRLLALLAAAGKGKNARALPILRTMLKKGGVYSDEIAVAIGRIGDPADLERFVAMDKRDSRHKVDLSGFGSMAIDRIMKDVNDPAVSARDKESIIDYLGRARGHETITRYQSLIHDKNSLVLKIAAAAITRIAEPGDEPLILRMLKDDNPILRREAISSLMKIWDARDEPLVLSALKNDPDDAVRARAAECLGTRRVCGADFALRSAMRDGSRQVRDAARLSLKVLYNLGTEALVESPHDELVQPKVDRRSLEAEGKTQEWQQFAALAALARSGYPEETVPMLGEIMTKGTDEVDRAGAIELLRQIGGDKAQAELTKALASSDPWLAKKAAASLADWIGECDGKPEPEFQAPPENKKP